MNSLTEFIVRIFKTFMFSVLCIYIIFLYCLLILSSSLFVSVLLQSFLKVEQIKQNFKRKLVGMVLNAYLSLKR